MGTVGTAEVNYTCTCASGYEGDGYVSCENSNECVDEAKTVGVCDHLAYCIDTEGSYECEVNPLPISTRRGCLALATSLWICALAC